VSDILTGVHPKPPIQHLADIHNSAGRTLYQKKIELYELKDVLIYIMLSSAINNAVG
jgi:hypothetical protein